MYLDQDFRTTMIRTAAIALVDKITSFDEAKALDFIWPISAPDASPAYKKVVEKMHAYAEKAPSGTFTEKRERCDMWKDSRA